MSAFIGIGPGRCGTTSLAKIVGMCRNASVRHESVQLRWDGSDWRGLEALASWLNAGGEELRGEVQHQLFPHIETLAEMVPGLKAVCLRRPREEYIKSQVRVGGKNLWPERTPYYPHIEAGSAREAYGRWWDMVEEMMDSLSIPSFNLATEALNDDAALTALYGFLGIAAADRSYPPRRVWNASLDRRATA